VTGQDSVERMRTKPPVWPGPGWRWIGRDANGDLMWVRGIEPPASRVHQLARLDTTALRAMYLQLKGREGVSHELEKAMGTWDRDRLVSRIRDLEDPLRLAFRGHDA
jgi:hypothetical protein